MIDRIHARRAELLKTHEALTAERAMVATYLERVRGAIALCDELLQAETAAPAADEAADPSAASSSSSV